MKLRPIIQDRFDFAVLRNGGFVYVDKTEYFHKMITDKEAVLYFVSRPRRFGKSLMISTLAEIFSGNRELFRGLKIDSLEWDWKPHRILRFSFDGVSSDSFEEFKASFAACVRNSFAAAGFAYNEAETPAGNFDEVLRSHKDIVVLVDEYDAPVGHAIGDPDLAEKIRSAMASFYVNLKRNSANIRFLMMTGVSKFTKLSVFSALNNIVDLSMKDEYAAMLGYTDEELEEYFPDHLREHARVMGLEYAEYRRRLKHQYNGFRFSKYRDVTVYSPISVAKALGDMTPEFEDYWSGTGRASMLMNAMKRESIWQFDPDGTIKVSESLLEVVDFRNMRPSALLFQTGYLTVKGYDRTYRRFELGAPNAEVRRDLAQLLANTLAGKPDGWALDVCSHLLDGEWDEFFNGVNSLYAALPPMRDGLSRQEVVYQRELALILAAQGFEPQTEVSQSEGRADLVVQSNRAVYVFELKVDAPASVAMEQIKTKGYAKPYEASGKDVWLVGMSFSSKKRRVVEHLAEQWTKSGERKIKTPSNAS